MSQAKWEYNDKGILSVDMPGYGKEEYKLTKIFTGFEEMTTIQKLIVVNGTKQKLADTTARNKDAALTPTERINVMNDRWNDLLNNIWNRKGSGSGGVKKAELVAKNKELESEIERLKAELKAAKAGKKSK
jgi:hypothetical protein